MGYESSKRRPEKRDQVSFATKHDEIPEFQVKKNFILLTFEKEHHLQTCFGSYDMFIPTFRETSYNWLININYIFIYSTSIQTFIPPFDLPPPQENEGWMRPLRWSTIANHTFFSGRILDGSDWNKLENWNLTGLVLHIAFFTKTNGQILQKLLWSTSPVKIWKLEKGRDPNLTCQVLSGKKNNNLAIKNLREIRKYIQIHHAGNKKKLKTPRERNHVNLIARSVYSRLVGKPLALFDSLPKIHQNTGSGGWQVLIFQAIESYTAENPPWVTWMLI